MENEVIKDEFEFSEETEQIIPAFIKFQSSLGIAEKKLINTFFDSKYEDLAEILKVTKKPLAENKLALIQFPTSLPYVKVPIKEMVLRKYNYRGKDYEKTVWTGKWIEINVREIKLTTYLMHESGQYIKSSYIETPEDNSHHAKGKAITYARRITAKPILGIAAEDNDGNPKANSENPDLPQKAQTGPSQPAKSKASKTTLTTTNARQTGVNENKKDPVYVVDGDGNKRFNRKANKFDDKFQKEHGYILTADWLAIQGLVTKNLKGNMKGFCNWVKSKYKCEFYDITKANHSEIVDILVGDPKSIMGV